MSMICAKSVLERGMKAIAGETKKDPASCRTPGPQAGFTTIHFFSRVPRIYGKISTS
jgi:hypothetical protein